MWLDVGQLFFALVQVEEEGNLRVEVDKGARTAVAVNEQAPQTAANGTRSWTVLGHHRKDQAKQVQKVDEHHHSQSDSHSLSIKGVVPGGVFAHLALVVSDDEPRVH